MGRGPFATVYGAVENASGRPVALKVFQSAGEVSEMLAREFGDLTRLDHPNLVRPTGLGSAADGKPVIVSDLCGDSLAHVIETKGPMDPQDVAGIGVKVAGALAALHDAGLLHQNLKPQNVLLSLMGEPALSDAGQVSFQMSVRAIASGTRFTAFHSPPEMFEAHELSPAADVYGLASTMYQLLSGHAPFQPFEDESAISVVLRILRDPVAEFPAEVPFSLAQLLESALAKDPYHRPQSAHAFAEGLREVAAGEGWTVAVAPSRQPVTAAHAPPVPGSDESPPDPSTRRLFRRNRRGVSQPPETDRNVVLPEGRRRGSMDRPPRRS
jgi:serine/threonine protein kinase